MHQLTYLRKQHNKSREHGFTVVAGGSTAATIDILPHECPFCQKNRQSFPQTVKRALYQKFAASQNYFYSKDVNEILTSQRGRALITFKDFSTLDETEELLRRVYALKEFEGKIQFLSEYYKFHVEIPRVFMIPIGNLLAKYHDKKRRIQYVKITRMLNIQPEDDSTHESQTMKVDHKSLECLLDMLNETKSKPHIHIVEEQQVMEHFLPRQKVTLNTLQSESNTLQEINLRLCEVIPNVTPKNPYLPTQGLMKQLAEERLTDMNLPKAFEQRSNRRTEPDLKKNVKTLNENQYDKPLQMQHPAVKRKMFSLAGEGQNQVFKMENPIRSQINTFFQEQQKRPPSLKAKATPLSSERQASKSKSSVSPNKGLKHHRNDTQSSLQSSNVAREKSSAKVPQAQEQKSDLLKLLQRNPNQQSFYKKQASPTPNKITKLTESSKTQRQDPIITQLIQKLQQGNSNLFQQLIQLTTNEKYKSKEDPQSVSTSRQRVNSQQSFRRQTQRSAQQSSSNLSSLLRPVQKPKQPPQLQQQRVKRVNSQNMESNPFHLNLERINLTNHQGQRLQTSRETFIQKSYQEQGISTKRVRSRGSLNQTTTRKYNF